MTMYRFTMKGISQAQEVRNVYYYDLAAETDPVKQSVVDALDSALKTNMQAKLANVFSVYGYDVQQCDTGGYPSVEFIPTAGGWAGSSGSGVIANQTAALVTFTGLTTPPNRCRKYIAGLNVGSMSSGLITSAWLTSLGLYAAAVIAADGLTDVQGPYSVRFTAGAPYTIVASNKVTLYQARQIPATQRRRRLGVGI